MGLYQITSFISGAFSVLVLPFYLFVLIAVSRSIRKMKSNMAFFVFWLIIACVDMTALALQFVCLLLPSWGVAFSFFQTSIWPGKLASLGEAFKVY